MSKHPNDRLSRAEVELLLPWYATGKVSAVEAEEVRRHLEANADLRAQLLAIDDDRLVSIAANEDVAAPSSGAIDRLMDDLPGVSRLSVQTPATSTLSGLLVWIEDALRALTPGRLGMAAAGLVGLMVLQAGIIGTLVSRPDQSGAVYEVAGGPEAKGVVLLVRFVTDAPVGEVAKFLEANRAVVISGPETGGVFKVRVGTRDLPKDDQDQIVDRFKEQTSLIRMVLPSR
ncbi:MAG: hypothetical protein AAFU56_05805 [Pseudomonadota bacterium]